jgi:cyclohexyl-isocyanide hydratase
VVGRRKAGTLKIGILIFDQVTQLDATGPFEALSRIPGAQVLLVAKSRAAITAEFGLKIMPDADFKSCPKLDMLLVPGGTGINPMLLDCPTLAFIRRKAAQAKYVTSVCTGSLLLGAAGLLEGKRAACHWLSLPLLKAFGARPSNRRIERDGRIWTAGGITAGIDFGLWVAGQIAGPRVAKEIQLVLQYDPQPPYRAGSPKGAGRAITETVTAARFAMQARRALLVEEAARRLN